MYCIAYIDIDCIPISFAGGPLLIRRQGCGLMVPVHLRRFNYEGMWPCTLRHRIQISASSYPKDETETNLAWLKLNVMTIVQLVATAERVNDAWKCCSPYPTLSQWAESNNIKSFVWDDLELEPFWPNNIASFRLQESLFDACTASPCFRSRYPRRVALFLWEEESNSARNFSHQMQGLYTMTFCTI